MEPLAKDRNAVDHKDKGASPLVFLLTQFNRAQSDLVLALVQQWFRRLYDERNFHLIERLRAIAIRPPKLRVWDLDTVTQSRVIRGNIATSSFQRHVAISVQQSFASWAVTVMKRVPHPSSSNVNIRA